MLYFLTGSKSYWIILTVIVGRYVILAGIAFLIFYVFRKEAWRLKKLQPNFPAMSDYTREIVFSILTCFIFAGIGYLMFLTPVREYTLAYRDISERGWGYLLFSVVLTLVVHDTYFYWTHRLMHHRYLFRIFHRVHHQSTNPSPWAAFAFHPLEAMVEAGIIVVVLFLYPIHPVAIGLFLLIMMIYNVYGHLGFELYPPGFSTSLIGRWFNTSRHHNGHHAYFTGNYGLYFLFWDRWMGTLRREQENEAGNGGKR